MHRKSHVQWPVLAQLRQDLGGAIMDRPSELATTMHGPGWATRGGAIGSATYFKKSENNQRLGIDMNITATMDRCL